MYLTPTRTAVSVSMWLKSMNNQSAPIYHCVATHLHPLAWILPLSKVSRYRKKNVAAFSEGRPLLCRQQQSSQASPLVYLRALFPSKNGWREETKQFVTPGAYECDLPIFHTSVISVGPCAHASGLRAVHGLLTFLVAMPHLYQSRRLSFHHAKATTAQRHASCGNTHTTSFTMLYFSITLFPSHLSLSGHSAQLIYRTMGHNKT